MNSLVLFIIKAVLVTGLLYGYYHLFLRNKKFHQYNRFYLLITLLLSVSIPFLNIPIYFLENNNPTAYKTLMVIYGNGEEDVLINSNISFWQSLLSWQNAAYFLYGCVAAFILCRFTLALISIYQLRKKYAAEKIEDIYLLNTTEPGTPFSFLNLLFWDSRIKLESDEGHKIFRHELFHIRQKHSLDILITEIFIILFWFNPFYHLIKKELRTIHEFLADQFAIDNSDNRDYAELLLMQALQTRQSLVHPFFHNQIKRRIAMITSSNKTSYQYLRKIMVLPVAALLVILFAFKIKKEQVPGTNVFTKPMTVVIDAGHGGADKGAHALDGSYEKDYNLAIANLVATINTNPDLKIVLTRSDDDAPDIKTRSAFANEQHADLFISLHCAAADQKTTGNTSGVEVYISGKNQTHEDNNKLIASLLVSQFSQIHHTNSDIIKPKTGIWVIDNSNCPAALVECGFITDKTDLAFIKNNQQQVAQAILAAIQNYGAGNTFSINEKPVADTGIKNALIYLDGVEQKGMSLDDLNKKIKPENIATVNVLKGDAAIYKYGEGAKNGVIEISTKSTTTDKKFTGKNPLIVIDGVEHPNSTMQEVNQKYKASDIVTVNVTKDAAAIAKYGSKAKDGVVEITTKKSAAPSPLIVIDNKEQPGMSMVELDKKVNPSSIQSVNVLKDQSAKDKYGDKGKNGVIEITTKKDTVPETKSNEPIFEKTETPSAFKGGELAWKKYLESNLDANVPVLNKAPQGQYTVMVQFIIDKEGNVSDLKPLTNHGFGMEEEVMRIIKKGPSWIPAKQNGHNVTSYRKQPLTFVISKERPNTKS